MNVIKLLKGAAFGLACLGMVVPQSVIAAGSQATQIAAKVQIADVSLNNGVLTGKVVNAQGQLQAGSVVKVSLNNKEVATVVASKEGNFEVANLSSGVYQVSTGQTQAAVRLWEGQAAPPAAKKNILLVNGPVTRAQLCGMGASHLGIAALAVTGVILSSIAIADDGDTTIVSP